MVPSLLEILQGVGVVPAAWDPFATAEIRLLSRIVDVSLRFHPDYPTPESHPISGGPCMPAGAPERTTLFHQAPEARSSTRKNRRGFGRAGRSVSPEVLEPRIRQLGVPSRVLNVLVT
jgi:hypothetical protein